MKIAIDGRVLDGSDGKAIFTKSVLAAWREQANHQYVVYGYQPAETEAWPDNWQFKPLTGRLGRVMTFRRLTEDVLFSPTSYLTTLLANLPTLTAIHDLIAYRLSTRLPRKTVISEKLFLGSAIRRSAALTVPTQSTLDDLIALFPASRGKTYLVSPGVAAVCGRSALPDEPTQRALLAKLGVTPPYILVVGTIEPRKNLVRLIDAFQSLPAQHGHAHQLVLAGKLGWLDDELQAKLAKLPPTVILTGKISDSEVATLYAHSQLVAYPSLYEGVGYPVLEAYYWHKPVITSNVSSMAEIGRPAARLVDPYSTESIARALEELLTDPTLAQTLAKRGQQQLSHYSWPKAAQTYLDILQQLC